MDLDFCILKFANFLRKAGISVSQSEVQDCIKGLIQTGLEKPVFYQVLRSTLIKDQSLFGIFDRAFQLYFYDDFLEGIKAPAGTGLANGFENTAFHGQDNDMECTSCHDYGPNWGVGQGSGRAGLSNRFLQVIRLGDPVQYREFVNEGIKSLGEISREHMNNIEETVRKVKVYLEWNVGINKLQRAAEKDESNRFWFWQSRIEELEKILKESLEKEFLAKYGEEAMEKVLVRENLNELDFYRLNENQVVEIRKKITRLGHRLATRLSYRKSRSKKGFVDIHRTIRTSMNTGGIPVRLAYRDRIPSKPEFWILCDVSGSVKRFSEFMLQLTYSIQSRFLHVRSFVFIDTLAEVSGCFQEKEIPEALAQVYNSLKFSKTGFSDYAQVFRELYEDYGPQMNKKITLLIIGDGRNNYRPTQEEYLMKVSEEVKSILWLNPLPVEQWNKEDGIIKNYLPYCKAFFECRNLEQLERLTRRIIPC